MALELVTTPQQATPTRRAFLRATCGLTLGLLLPGTMVEAATRRSSGVTPKAKRGTQRRPLLRAKRKTARKQTQRTAARRAPAPFAPAADMQGLARLLHPQHRSLSLLHLHTGERTTVDYFVDGAYDTDCLRELNWLLRDHRTYTAHTIDPGVLDLLYAIRTQIDSEEELHIVCGYRSPLTNMLKLLSGAGVAERSYHLTGQAIDFSIPRRPLHQVQRTALALQSGGVGYYPRSGFVHVDTGPVRYW